MGAADACELPDAGSKYLWPRVMSLASCHASLAQLGADAAKPRLPLLCLIVDISVPGQAWIRYTDLARLQLDTPSPAPQLSDVQNTLLPGQAAPRDIR